MDRLACVNLSAFPLQLLIRSHPEWKSHPIAVVDHDKPQGVILWVNKHAARLSILPGMRYAKGLSLAPDLRAGVVATSEIKREIDLLVGQFRFFTPDVEPSRTEPGVFWLNASGLSLLYPSLKKWAGLIGKELSMSNFYWSIAAGFSRYATHAVARASHKITVFETPGEEREHARRLPIVRLGFPPNLRDALAQLAIKTLGDFINLPEDGIRKRFGNEAYDLYKLARDELFRPLEANIPVEPFAGTAMLDHPEANSERLMVHIERMLDPILSSIQKKNHLLTALRMSFVLDNKEKRDEHLRLASPTLDATQILKLIDLRLQNISLVSGVVDITLHAEADPEALRQLELFAKKPRRDPKAVDRAFAQLRAELGNDVVMRARLRDGHLPEACYEWEPMDKIPDPAPRKIQARNLVRRIFARSVAFLSWARRQGDGRLQFHEVQRSLEQGSLTQGSNVIPFQRNPSQTVPARRAINPSDIVGPYIVSGGWWMRRVHREYYFVRSNAGRWLWIYYDKRRRQSFVQGTVE